MNHNVAYLVNHYPAPSHTFIRREIEALEALGWRVHRFSHRSGYAALVDEVDIAEQERTSVLLSVGPLGLLFSVVRRALREPLRVGKTLALALRMASTGERRFVAHLGYVGLACVLADRLDRLDCPHLHAHFSTNSSDVALLCHELCDIPYSMTFHGSYEYEPSNRYNLRDKISNASFVVVISKHGYQSLVSQFPEYVPKIKQIPCGLGEEWLCRTPSPVPQSRQLLCVARLAEHKNPALLIQAATLLRERGVPFRLVFVGDGPLRPKLERLIAENNLSNQVLLAGWRSQTEIMEYLEQSCAIVLSSASEGIPVAIMESFAMGRPAIAIDVGGVGELVETGSTGWLVPPDDPYALHEAMRECLCADLGRLQMLANEGRQRVLGHDVHASSIALGKAFLESGRLLRNLNEETIQ